MNDTLLQNESTSTEPGSRIELDAAKREEMIDLARAAREDLNRLVAAFTYVSGDVLGPCGAAAAEPHREPFAKAAASLALSLEAIRETFEAAAE